MSFIPEHVWSAQLKVLTVSRCSVGSTKSGMRKAILIWLKGRLSGGQLSPKPGKSPAENKEICNYSLTCNTLLSITDRSSLQKTREDAGDPNNVIHRRGKHSQSISSSDSRRWEWMSVKTAYLPGTETAPIKASNNVLYVPWHPGTQRFLDNSQILEN